MFLLKNSRHTMNFLTQKDVVTADPATHKELLKTIWFGMYSRGQGKIGSSGFEHVFLSEVRDGAVIGLHNWIYFADEEKNRDLDYKGWMKKIDLGNVSNFDDIIVLCHEKYFFYFIRKDKLRKSASHWMA